METTTINLTQTKTDDLDLLFQFQLDEEASYLAAFTSKDRRDKDAYEKKWTRLLSDPTITIRTIKENEKIVGSVSKYIMNGNAEITYWLDRKSWGKGIATAALKSFLAIENVRPIYGHVAFDNFASQRVLEKCGFKKIGLDKGFANARQMEIEEFIYLLDK